MVQEIPFIPAFEQFIKEKLPARDQSPTAIKLDLNRFAITLVF